MLLTLLSAATLAAVAVPPTQAAVTPQVPPSVVSSELPLDPSVWKKSGSRIPDVELPRVDGGGLVRLSDFEGKKVLLLQFASW